MCITCPNYEILNITPLLSRQPSNSNTQIKHTRKYLMAVGIKYKFNNRNRDKVFDK